MEGELQTSESCSLGITHYPNCQLKKVVSQCGLLDMAQGCSGIVDLVEIPPPVNIELQSATEFAMDSSSAFYFP